MPKDMDLPQQNALDKSADNTQANGSQDKAGPKAARPGDQGIGKIGADHVEGRMGNIQDAHHAEHEGEARGHQEEEHPVNETMHRLNQINRSTHEDVLSADFTTFKFSIDLRPIPYFD